MAVTTTTQSSEWFTAIVGPDARVDLSGQLDIAGLDALRAALDQALQDPGELIAVNVEHLAFVDSLGLSELLRYQLCAAARGRHLQLQKVPDVVAHLLDALDLRHVLMAPIETGPGPLVGQDVAS